MNIRTPLASVTLALALCGCDRPAEETRDEQAPAEVRACTNMLAIMEREAPESVEGDNGDVDRCVENVRTNNRGCRDADAALECMASAVDGDSLVACGRHCN